jgi:hypothetical protein
MRDRWAVLGQLRYGGAMGRRVGEMELGMGVSLAQRGHGQERDRMGHGLEKERGFDVGEETGDVTGLVTWPDLATRLDSSQRESGLAARSHG